MAVPEPKVAVVSWLPVETKTWLEREAGRRGLSTSAYVRTILVGMQNRAAA